MLLSLIIVCVSVLYLFLIIVLMNILLVGCTGFLGKSLIHYFITHTSHHLMVVIRPKHQLTINERLQNILNELNIKEQKRIVPVKVTYDDSRTIIMDNKDKIMIQRKVHVLINALADVKFNRPLQKATLNNTVTALNWMFFFQKCQHPVKYIYVSSAFVNFHITNDGIIEEKIYERNMSEKTLVDILSGKRVALHPYHNSYLFSKQLAEILLFRKRRSLSLAIFRPSVLSPAVKYPYCGWTAMQSLNYIFFGMATGAIPFWNISREDVFDNNANIIPVDIAAKDCASLVSEDSPFTIRHSCFTGNNPYCISYFDLYIYLLEAYRYYKKKPISINNHTYSPFFPFFVKDYPSFYLLFLLCYFIVNRFSTRKDILHLLKILKITLQLTQRCNIYLPHFVSKKVIFKREPVDKWFNKRYPQKKSYKVFIEKMDLIIKNDANLMKLFRQ